MIGQLPKSIEACGKIYPLRKTDFRSILVIVQACNDPELSDLEKSLVMVDCLVGLENVNSEKDFDGVQTACRIWMDGGVDYSSRKNGPKLIDWDHDEQMIFSALNHVYGRETRTETNMHWWTFLGLFNEIGEGLFSTVLSIRQKKSKGKKLTSAEKDFYAANRDLVDLKPALTEEERKQLDELNARFK